MTTSIVGNLFNAHPKDMMALRHLDQSEDDTQPDTSNNPDPDSDELANSTDPDTQGGNPKNTDSDKDRYENLRKWANKTINDLKLELKQRDDKLKEASTPKIKPPKTEEELKVFKSQFPEIYDSVVSLALQYTEQSKEDVKKDIEELKAQRQEIYNQREKDKVLLRHPDLETLLQSQDFQDWILNQSPGVRKLILDGQTAEDVIEGFDLYKLKTGKNKASKDSALDASRATPTSPNDSVPNSGPKRKWKESEIQKLSARDFSRYEKDIMEASAEGRVIFDVSEKIRK